jgi:murein L,D-transpeptidase YcbB/YkuD
MNKIIRVALLFGALTGFGPAVLSQTGSNGDSLQTTLSIALGDESAETLSSVIRDTYHPDLKWPRFPYYQDELQGLYGMAAGYVWLVGGQPRSQVSEAIEILADAESRGLDPSDYDVSYLRDLAAAINSGGARSARELALFDTAMSIAMLRHISDLHIGRINPKSLNVDLDVDPKKYDLAALLFDAIAEDRISETVTEAEPPYLQYLRLKVALDQYRYLAQKGDLETVPIGPTVHPGERYAGVPQLRRRLTAFGDLDESDSNAAGDIYEGNLVTALKHFQERHGLEVDGVIGKGTFAALNVSPAQRERQLELALERIRWVPLIGADRKVLVVNIPAFWLWAFGTENPDGRPMLAMNVVVGKALNSHQTPVFIEEMRYLEFTPYWNVPRSITVNELLPKIARDPNYISANHYEIVPNFGNDVGALPVSSANIAKVKAGGLQLRQRPGPKNALGAVKFIFPNNNNIYLHSTPAQSLFSRTRRDFSHGCIRVEYPEALAEFVLSSVPGWDRNQIADAMVGSRPTRVDLTNRIPVLIYYTTAVVDADGDVHFYGDIYGHDAVLDEALRAGYPYPP